MSRTNIDKLDRLETRRRAEAADDSSHSYGRVDVPERSKALLAPPVEKVRWDDPARHFVEALRPKVSRHRAPPNRFSIEPGQAWDGVDRSNGFEVKLFQKRASRKVMRDLEHNYSVQDL